MVPSRLSAVNRLIRQEVGSEGYLEIDNACLDLSRLHARHTLYMDNQYLLYPSRQSRLFSTGSPLNSELFLNNIQYFMAN